MTVSINKSKEVFEYFKSKIASVKRNEHLSSEGKAAALKEIDAELGAQYAYWKEEVAKEKNTVEAEAEKLKPDTVNRSLDTETVATLEYQTKAILSRIAAEGNTLESFRALLTDIVGNGNDTTRQAFLDSFHEVKSLAESFDHSGKMYLKGYYDDAKKSMKTPEQVDYENALADAVAQSNSLTTKLIAAERVIADIKASISADVHAAGGNKTASVW